MKNLDNLKTVIKFTIKDAITRPAFIITTVIFLVLIVAGFNIPSILEAFDVNESSFMTNTLIIDSENIYKDSLSNINDMELGYEIQVKNEEVKIEDLKSMINNGEVDEALIIKEENEVIKIEYMVKNMNSIMAPPEALVNTLNEMYKTIKISELGLSEEQLKSITPILEFSVSQAEEIEVESNPFIGMMVSFVLFMAIYMFAVQVSMSITTEKTSKIMETLVTSTSPRVIVIGKTLGMGIVGLFQIVLILATAAISANIFLEPGMLESFLSIETINPIILIYVIIYFILGYFMYAFMYALTGSTVTKPEDVQSANGPVAILAIIGFYLAYFTIFNPTSAINQFASIFPLSSPFSMPSRILMGAATTTDIILSIVLLILTTAITAFISIKIYSNAILNTGTKLSLKNIIGLYKAK